MGLWEGRWGALYHAAELSLDGEEFRNHVSVGVERRAMLLAWEGDGLKEKLSRCPAETYQMPGEQLSTSLSVPTQFMYKEAEYSIT